MPVSRSTPPLGTQLALPGLEETKPPQVSLTTAIYRRKTATLPPLVDGFSSAKRVPDAFFCPEGTITIEMIAAKAMRGELCTPAQLKKLLEAYEMLVRCSEGQLDPKTGKKLVRDDGSDYLQHAMRVAYRIALLGRGRPQDLQQVIAALLHDIVEDYGVRLETIQDKFGKNVAEMVFWLTKPKWDGKDWVWPGNPKYYTMEDKYDHSMYDRRGNSYYRRLYYDSGNPSAWVIKAADNLDNLHTLMNVEKSKMQRNIRLIVNNTLAVLSRMLAKEDTERLTEYIKDELGFEVPPDAIAPFADSWIITCEPRESLLRRGLEGVHAPRHGQINVYGADPKYLLLLGWLEVGLPDDGKDYLGLLRSMFGREYAIREEESYLPSGLAASEKIFRISGFRQADQLRPYEFNYDPQQRRVHILKEGKPFVTVGLGAVDELAFEEPQLRALLKDMEEKCRVFFMGLEDFQQNQVRAPTDSPG